MASELRQDRLKELLSCNPETGGFRWRVQRGNRPAGAPAACRDAYGYVVIRIDDVLYKAHRLAWLYTYGEMPKMSLDHINRVKDDNRIANLRDVSQSANALNASVRVDSATRVKGVVWSHERKKWVARIKVNGKTIHLGRFCLFTDACAARALAERELRA